MLILIGNILNDALQTPYVRGVHEEQDPWHLIVWFVHPSDVRGLPDYETAGDIDLQAGDGRREDNWSDPRNRNWRITWQRGLRQYFYSQS